MIKEETKGIFIRNISKSYVRVIAINMNMVLVLVLECDTRTAFLSSILLARIICTIHLEVNIMKSQRKESNTLDV